MRDIQHFIAGSAFAGTSGRYGEVFDPNTGEIQARVALANQDDFERAVKSALTAQPIWAATNPQRRARVMFEFKRLVEARMDELAALLSSEHGKVVADSRGDIQRGLEVVEFACGVPHAMKGACSDALRPGCLHCHHLGHARRRSSVGRSCVSHTSIRFGHRSRHFFGMKSATY